MVPSEARTELTMFNHRVCGLGIAPSSRYLNFYREVDAGM